MDTIYALTVDGTIHIVPMIDTDRRITRFITRVFRSIEAAGISADVRNLVRWQCGTYSGQCGDCERADRASKAAGLDHLDSPLHVD